jgi:hypothetical protein
MLSIFAAVSHGAAADRRRHPLSLRARETVYPVAYAMDSRDADGAHYGGSWQSRTVALFDELAAQRPHRRAASASPQSLLGVANYRQRALDVGWAW